MSGWQTRAACRSEDPELWFAEAKDTASQRMRALAKHICAHCPVRIICVVENHDQPHGIWAGHDTNERKAAIRRAEHPDIDHVAIDRRANGENVPLTRPEKITLARRLLREGHSQTHTAKVVGLRHGDISALARAIREAA